MSKTDAAVDLSIIIVNWNVKALLANCLRSISQYTRRLRYEVIVIDNASSDGSAVMVRRQFPEVKLVAATTNLGFTKGNNVGLAMAVGRHICYLNPDTELIEDIFSPLVRYLDEHTEVGVVAPKLLNSDQTHQNSIGVFTRLSNLWREYFLRTKAETARVYHPDQPTVVEVVMGACMVCQGAAVRSVGGFDERYFMYHEETDLCLTLKEKGFDTVYDPEVSLIHHGSKSSTINPESRQRTLHENRKSQYLFFQKHYGFVSAQLAKFIIILAMLIRIIPFALLNVVHPSEVNVLKVRYFGQTLRWLSNH